MQVAARSLSIEPCQLIHNHMSGLVETTSSSGYISALGVLPKGMVMTVTTGGNNSPNSQTCVILPAAKWLLRRFRAHYQTINAERVRLLDAFINRTHSTEVFHHIFTLVLWRDCPPGNNMLLEVRWP